MKTNNQVCSKRSAKAAAQQVSRTPHSASGLNGTAADAGAVRIAWFNPDGSEAMHVDFEPALFALIEQSAKQEGGTVDEWIERAVREKVQREIDKADELAGAIGQVQALCNLLERQVLCPEDGEWSEAHKVGLTQLTGQSFDRLERAAVGAFVKGAR